MLCGAEVDLIGSSGGNELEGWKREVREGVLELEGLRRV